MSRPLPPNPSLKQLKTQAKDLLKAHQAGDPEAIARIKESFPRLSDASPEEIRAARLCLRDAQLVVAREYGFANWAKLAAAFGESAKPPCSFCGRFQGQVQKILQGPSVHICDECVRTSRDFLRQEDLPGWATDSDERCSFCGISSSRVDMATGRDRGKTICANCLELCIGILESRPQDRASESPPAARSEPGRPACSICTRHHPEVRVFDLPGGELWVCNECVDACRRTLAEAPAGDWKKTPESTCGLCRRNASYSLELATTRDGRVCLCGECADLLHEIPQGEGKSAAEKEKNRVFSFFRKIAQQLAEKHRAGDPDALRRVETVLPGLRHLSPEEIRRAPLEPEEAYHVLIREFVPRKEKARDDFEHTYVGAMLDLTNGPPPRRPHRRFLEDHVEELLDAHRRGRPQAARRIKATLPNRTNTTLDGILQAPLSREDAQTLIACEYGLDSWPELLARDEIGHRYQQVRNDCHWLANCATRIATDLGHKYVGTEHVLLALIRGFSKEMPVVLDILNLDRQAMEKSIQDFFDSQNTREDSPAYNLFPLHERISTTSIKIAAEMGYSVLHSAHFLLALIEDPRSGAARILASNGVDYTGARKRIGRNAAKFDVAKSAATSAPGSRGISSDTYNQVMQYAREESAHLGHNYIGSEHLLLGIIRESNSKAIKVLTNLGIDLHALRDAIVDYVGPSGGSRPADEEVTQTVGEAVPWTPRAEQILMSAHSEAGEMAPSPRLAPPRPVDVEHLLVALLKEREGVAAQILAGFGVDYEMALRETQAVLEVDSVEDEGKDED